jgi:hypothetical protein
VVEAREREVGRGSFLCTWDCTVHGGTQGHAGHAVGCWLAQLVVGLLGLGDGPGSITLGDE